jgi:hypothetical protein
MNRHTTERLYPSQQPSALQHIDLTRHLPSLKSSLSPQPIKRFDEAPEFALEFARRRPPPAAKPDLTPRLLLGACLLLTVLPFAALLYKQWRPVTTSQRP